MALTSFQVQRIATASTFLQPPPIVLPMKELFRSTDPVRISRAVAVLEDHDIPTFEMDQHMSVLEGSLGILPRRVMVADRDAFMARAILRDVGLDE
jgi:hypothetical protein